MEHKADKHGWLPIESAPKGWCHPYTRNHPEPATFVLVWNGYHVGVAYCVLDEEREVWWAEDGTFEPDPTHWQPLPAPPESENE